VDDPVTRLRRSRIGFRLRQIADHRLHASHGDALGLLAIAHERRHLMPASQQSIEYR
jgi:hypothetical protein